jgi:hypothetical protein
VISIRLHLTLPIPCRRPARVQQEGLEHSKGVRLIPLFSSSACLLLGYGCWLLISNDVHMFSGTNHWMLYLTYHWDREKACCCVKRMD